MNELPIELYRAAQVRELDRIAIKDRGIPGYTLMTRAGQATLAALKEIWPRHRRVVVVCGAGNNAGDGYVVARLARENGFDVRILALGDVDRLKGDALTAYEDAKGAGVAMQPFDPTQLAEAEVIVDAILGTGLEREVTGAWAEAIRAMNASRADILAVDIPSGLHADCGTILGTAVHARATATFIGLKQGMFTGQGPACSGTVLYDDLGVDGDVHKMIHPACRRYPGDDLGQLLPRRSRSAHKGHFGHVLVIGGEHGMAGAARMAAEAAARCGAGLVSVATRASHVGMQVSGRPELMFHGVESVDELAPLLAKATVVAVGPGLGRGEWGSSMLDFALRSDRPLVVDADGLNLLANHPTNRGNWILTPHPGEASRLLKMTTAQVESDRFTAVSDLAVRFGGVCLLKGAGTLIASEQGGLRLSSTGNPGMACGGMGDILTGVIASLVAQGLSLQQAAQAGVYIHGRAGDRAAETGERGLLAMDLMPFLRELVNPADQ